MPCNLNLNQDDRPEVYWSHHRDELIARLGTPTTRASAYDASDTSDAKIGLLINRMKPAVFPDVPLEALVAFTAGRGTNEDTTMSRTRPNSFHEIGVFNVPAGDIVNRPSENAPTNARLNNAWNKICGASAPPHDPWPPYTQGIARVLHPRNYYYQLVDQCLSRVDPAQHPSTTPGVWSGGPGLIHQVAVGLVNLRYAADNFYGTVQPRMGIPRPGTLWDFVYTLLLFKGGNGPWKLNDTANSFYSRSEPDHLSVPITTLWDHHITKYLLELHHLGRAPVPPSERNDDYNNHAFAILRVMQILRSGRELAATSGATSGASSWFATSLTNENAVIDRLICAAFQRTAP